MCLIPFYVHIFSYFASILTRYFCCTFKLQSKMLNDLPSNNLHTDYNIVCFNSLREKSIPWAPRALLNHNLQVICFVHSPFAVESVLCVVLMLQRYGTLARHVLLYWITDLQEGKKRFLLWIPNVSSQSFHALHSLEHGGKKRLLSATFKKYYHFCNIFNFTSGSGRYRARMELITAKKSCFLTASPFCSICLEVTWTWSAASQSSDLESTVRPSGGK